MEEEYIVPSTCPCARRMAMIRAQWACEHVDSLGNRCMSCMDLDAHHLTYARYGHEDPEDLMIVCRAHHIEIHGH